MRMPQLALNKTSLARESRQLDTYERFLPSLDLKRMQLIAERNNARRELQRLKDAIDEIESRVGERIPMAADERISLRDIVAARLVRLDEENVVGLSLPVLRDIDLHEVAYSLLARPHWVDTLVVALKELLKLRIKTQVQQRRLDILDAAVKKITQRVNLFDKVLIPRTRENIRRIRISLSDTERAAVVNAKIAKRKRQAV